MPLGWQGDGEHVPASCLIICSEIIVVSTLTPLCWGGRVAASMFPPPEGSEEAAVLERSCTENLKVGVNATKVLSIGSFSGCPNLSLYFFASVLLSA